MRSTSRRRLWSGSSASDLEEFVYSLLVLAATNVQRRVAVDHDFTIDFIAEGISLPQKDSAVLNRVGIECKLSLTPTIVHSLFDSAKDLFRQAMVDEFWIVTPQIDLSILGGLSPLSEGRRFRIFRAEGFASDLGVRNIRDHQSSKARRQVARTKSGKAVNANHHEILIAAATLETLVGDRITSLSAAPPNSPDAQTKWKEELSQLEMLSSELKRLRKTVEDFISGEQKESELNTATNSFNAKIEDWWNKDYVRICDSAFNMGMFALGVTVCSMVGSGGTVAVAVSAALVGGKSVAEALRGLKGKLLG
jgi:hypothetical protein